MAEGSVGTATFLMTDIEGSTRLWESAPETAGRVVRHDALVREAVTAHGGALHRERGEGDSHFATFGNPADAARAAVALQCALLGEPGLAAAIRVRIGIHVGEASFRDMEYYGPAVNRCARIRGVGHGGQVLVSEAAAAILRDALPPGVTLRDLGLHRLRDLLRPERLYQVVAPGLRTEFPELASLNASNIPIQPTSFVGRVRELATVVERLRGTRLVTLLGTGGVGKTRLAYQAAAEAAGSFAEGVCVVELAETPTDEGVAPAVERALGLTVATLRDLMESLRERRLLLVLDNCEHVLGGVRSLLQEVQRACPEVSVLATSRQTLRLPGERTVEVPPLSLPALDDPTPESLAEAEASRLFVERAGAGAPRFAATAANAAAIARVCARLDGLPLLIELAAARCNVLTPAQIDERLGRRLSLLGGGRATEEGRHRTMRACFDWSFRMLDPAERCLMGRATAFRGGWTMEGIEAALAGRWPFDDDPLEVLTGLVERSLVFVEDLSGDAVRYRLLETIREYAQETTPAEELATADEGLFAWADGFAAEAGPQMEGPEQQAWFDRADAERENLRAAVHYASQRAELRARGLRTVTDLARFWMVRGHYTLGLTLLAPLLRLAEGLPVALRAKATNLAGVLAMCRGDLPQAEERLTESITLAAESDDEQLRGSALCNLGMIAWKLKDYERARGCFEEGTQVLEGAGNPTRVGTVRMNLGCVLMDMGRYDEARPAFENALALFDQQGDTSGLAFVRGNLGLLAILHEDWPEARRLVEESLVALGQLGDHEATMNTLVSAILLLIRDGDREAATVLRGVILGMVASAQASLPPRDEIRIGEIDADLGTNLAPSDRERWLRKGRNLKMAFGVEYAIRSLSQSGQRSGEDQP